MISSLGTHGHIPHLKKPPAKQRLRIRRIFSELFETLGNRTFLALFMAAIFGAAATGVSAALSFYFGAYYWEFSTAQLGLLTVSAVISSIVAGMITGKASKNMGKKNAAILVGVLAFTLAPLPITLRLFDLMPENGAPLLFVIVLITTIVDVALIITFQILMSSMLADAVEESEIKTTRRSEGVFFSSITFAAKMVTGVGITAATGILSYAGLQTGIAPGDVQNDVLSRLGTIYAPVVFTLWMTMILCLRFYKIDRRAHEDNLQNLGRSA